ncbi:MAG: GAF domain-containing protein, partial [Nakamurella sp.]
MTATFQSRRSEPVDGWPGSSEAQDEYELLDTAPEAVFDDLIGWIVQRFGVAHAQLSVVTPDRVWIKAGIGNQGTSRAPDDTLCAVVAADRSTTVVPDARNSVRFAHHPRVNQAGGLRFYAGVPLIGHDGTVLGALCAWDDEPRYFTDDDVAALEECGRHAMALLELRRSNLQLRNQDAVLRAHTRVLELIVEGAALPVILAGLVRAVENSTPSTRASFCWRTGTVAPRRGAEPAAG